jgi:hypothetical protein
MTNGDESTETLRRASALLREPHVAQDPFMRAVAEWLANICDWWPENSVDADSAEQMHAVTVARAYLRAEQEPSGQLRPTSPATGDATPPTSSPPTSPPSP